MSIVEAALIIGAFGALITGIGSLASWRKINAVSAAVNDVGNNEPTLRALVVTQGERINELHDRFDAHITFHLTQGNKT